MLSGLMNKSLWTDLINCVSTFVSDHNRDGLLSLLPAVSAVKVSRILEYSHNSFLHVTRLQSRAGIKVYSFEIFGLKKLIDT